MRSLRRIVAYPAALLRVVSRDRTSVFFMVLLPVAIVVAIGYTFGGANRLDVGVVREGHGAVSDEIVERLRQEPAFSVHGLDDVASLDDSVRRGEVTVGVVVPAAVDEPIAPGEHVTLPIVSRPGNSQGLAASIGLQSALSPVNSQLLTAQVLQRDGSTTWADAVGRGGAAARGATSAITTVDVGSSSAAGAGRFSQTVSQNLVLFVFTNALAGASFFVTVRRNGVLQRSLSSAASHGEILLGLGLAILAVTVVQSLIIVGAGSLVFRVRWGDPLAAIVLLTVSDLAAAAAGLFIGTVADNADRAGALAPIVGIVTGVLGGCVVPLEVFPGALVRVAHAVPQFWAVDAWSRLIFESGGLGDVAGNLVALGGFTVVLGAASMALLRRELTARR